MNQQFTVDKAPNEFDFGVTVSPSWKTVRPNESTSFQIDTYSRADNGTAQLSVDSAPAGLVYSFAQTALDAGGSSRFDIQCDSADFGIYYVRINASRSAISHSITITLLVEPQIKKGSAIVIHVASASIMCGENITINGEVSPPQTTLITLRYVRPEGQPYSIDLKSDSNGTFTYSFEPYTVGQWKFSAVWLGDYNHVGSQSGSVTVQVEATPLSSTEAFMKQLQAMKSNLLGTILIFCVFVMLLYRYVVLKSNKQALKPAKHNLRDLASLKISGLLFGPTSTLATSM